MVSDGKNPRWRTLGRRLAARLLGGEAARPPAGSEAPLPTAAAGDDAGFEPRYRPLPWWRRLLYLLTPKVSKRHLYEAQERYALLRNVLEYREDAPAAPDQDEDLRDGAIACCRNKLVEIQPLLTRRQQDLNFLWREMTRVYIMLFERVIPPKSRPSHVDLLQEEARKLGVAHEPEVAEMQRRMAEVMDDHNPSKEGIARHFRSLLERFNTLRTGRIHQQWVNMSTYLIALCVLVPLAAVMIANSSLVLRRTPAPRGGLGTAATATGPAASERASLLAAGVQGADEAPTGPAGTTGTGGAAGPGSGGGVAPLPALVASIRRLLAENVMAFLFLSGLAGGFFSIAIRIRERRLVPGEDAYFKWYVLTKPLVGAMGAMMLYVLVVADVVSVNLLDSLVRELQQGRPGAVLFAFGFLAGFSERFLFPSLSTGNGRST